MRKLLSIIVFSFLALGLFACSGETKKETTAKAVNYQLIVNDIDGKVLLDEKISSNKSAYEEIRDNYQGIVVESTYGNYFSSIMGSAIDPNYYLAFYINGEYSSVSISVYEVKENDRLLFEVCCWNTTALDEIDIKLDQVVYSFLRDKADNFFTNGSCDYSLGSAIFLMNEKYKTNFDINKDSIKEKLLEIDVDNLSSGTELFKYAIKAKLSGLDLEKIKEAYQSFNTVLTSNQAAYFLLGANAINATSDNITSIKNNLVQNIKLQNAGDMSLIVGTALSVYNSLDGYNDGIKDMCDKLKTIMTKTGVDYYSINGASTAQAIMALCANNINPRSSEYEVEQTDLVEALLMYYKDGVFNYTLNSSPDLNFTTPQAISALVVYKIFRDFSEPVCLYS